MSHYLSSQAPRHGFLWNSLRFNCSQAISVHSHFFRLYFSLSFPSEFLSPCCQIFSVSFFLNSLLLFFPQLFSSHSRLSSLCIHWCACSGLAHWWAAMQPRQVSKPGKNGELKGPSRARLPKYLWTDWLISTLKMSHLSPHTEFLTVSKGPLFLTTSSLSNHLHCGRIAPLLLTKTDTIEPVRKVSLGQDDVNNS